MSLDTYPDVVTRMCLFFTFLSNSCRVFMPINGEMVICSVPCHDSGYLMSLFRFCPKSIGINSYPSFSNKSVSISKWLTFLMDSMTIFIFFFLSLMMCWL